MVQCVDKGSAILYPYHSLFPQNIFKDIRIGLPRNLLLIGFHVAILIVVVVILISDYLF